MMDLRKRIRTLEQNTAPSEEKLHITFVIEEPTTNVEDREKRMKEVRARRVAGENIFVIGEQRSGIPS
jgi:16S rRNA G1207 methylase RsmC